MHKLPSDMKSSRLDKIEKKHEPKMCELLTQLYTEQTSMIDDETLESVRQNHRTSHVAALDVILNSPLGDNKQSCSPTIDNGKVSMYRGNAVLVRERIHALRQSLVTQSPRSQIESPGATTLRHRAKSS